jgi:cytochrome subunit of sulfide dehydrogenase
MAWQLTPAGTFKLRRGRVSCDRAKLTERTTANGARRIIALLMATSPFVFVMHQSAAVENNRGAQLAAMCASCHRLDGRDHGIPSIIGLDAKKLADTMEAFRSGKRSSQIMQVVARSLSTEEIAALADYLAMQRRGPGQP